MTFLTSVPEAAWASLLGEVEARVGATHGESVQARVENGLMSLDERLVRRTNGSRDFVRAKLQLDVYDAFRETQRRLRVTRDSADVLAAAADAATRDTDALRAALEDVDARQRHAHREETKLEKLETPKEEIQDKTKHLTDQMIALERALREERRKRREAEEALASLLRSRVAPAAPKRDDDTATLRRDVAMLRAKLVAVTRHAHGATPPAAIVEEEMAKLAREAEARFTTSRSACDALHASHAHAIARIKVGL